MNYEQMKDRELDELVAKNVMVLKVLPKWEHFWSAEDDLDMLGEYDGSMPHPCYLDERMLGDDDSDTSIQGYSKWAVRAVPRYSRFVADAFRVVDTMRERDGMNVEIASLPEDNGWKVEFYNFPRVGACIDKLPTRAICIAALRALDE